MAGAWKMLEDGSFVLDEPYATMVEEARLLATKGWRDGLYDYLEPRTRYTREQLNEALLRINEELDEPTDIVMTFVVRALEGEL